MRNITTERPKWKHVLQQHVPLILPAAYDALSARMIERVGFPAYQIGGFALAASLHAVPDVDLEHFGEKSAAARRIIYNSPLPALVDGDDGYGDAKNVTRTVCEYEAIGASAIFLEDQQAPKRCGHMSGKRVVPVEDMEQKIRAAVAARSDRNFFILARTDAIEPNGLADALQRGERYIKAGADGIYIEGPTDEKQLQCIGKAFGGFPLATSILEGGGKTPWLPPDELHRMGFTMLLYPTTLLFRITRALERTLDQLKAGRPMLQSDAVDMKQFEEIVDMDHWSEIEKRFAMHGEKDEKSAGE